ncbi:hypothetical protein OHJ16_12555 [Actinomyces israelii]|jgi:hypothetical protein|uniref:Uncharacterized protein n=1 Tax=Actinomyces israelii TaxID=1659 RepID=A0ABT4IAW6_9ACTO|nr:hypothetical protein [Actinomyces israelii]MCZ0858872.1 hypothetical protein [Actinomyces israelii]WKR22812.1 hypothetical protein AIF0345_2768 [Actinomyces israelii]
MTNRYQISDSPEEQASSKAFVAPTRKAGMSAYRAVLWALVVTLAIMNGLSTAIGLNFLVSAAFGGLTVVCIALLVGDYLKKNRER